MLPAGESTTGCMPISGESQLQMTDGYDGPGVMMAADREEALDNFASGDQMMQDAQMESMAIAADVTIANHDPAGGINLDYPDTTTPTLDEDPYLNSNYAGFAPMNMPPRRGLEQKGRGTRARMLKQIENRKNAEIRQQKRKLLEKEYRRMLPHDNTTASSTMSPYNYNYDTMNSAPNVMPSSMAPGMNSFSIPEASTMDPQAKAAVMNMYFDAYESTSPYPTTAPPGTVTTAPPTTTSTTSTPYHLDFGYNNDYSYTTSAALVQDSVATTMTTTTSNTLTVTPHWLLGWDYRYDYMWDDITQMSIETIVYTGTNATLMAMYPSDTDYEVAMTAEHMETGLNQMQDEQQSKTAQEMNTTVKDVFDAQMSYDGDLHVPSFIPPNYDCWQHGTSNFVEQCYDEYYGYYSVQKDFGAICEHRKWVQAKAMEVAEAVKKVVEQKAYTEAHSGLSRRVRRMLKEKKSSVSESVPTYVRKLLKLPQEWEHDAKRRLSNYMMQPEAMFNDFLTMDSANSTGQDSSADLPANLMVDSMYNMMTYNESQQVESPDAVASMLVGLESTMDPDYVAAVDDMLESFERRKLDIYMQARSKPNYLQVMLNMGLNQTEKIKLMRDIQEVVYAQEPGACTQMGAAYYKPGGCNSLYEEQLGCANLRWISTYYDQYTYQEYFNDSWTQPHNRCEQKKRELRSLAIGGTNKESAPMLQALSQLLQRIGDGNYPSTGFSELLWKTGLRKPLTASEVTNLHAICTSVYDGTNGWGVKQECRYDDCGNEIGCNFDKRGQREVKDILNCPNAVPPPPGTCASQAGGNFYCTTAKADFIHHCKNVLDFLVEMMPAEDHYDPVSNNWIAGYHAEQMRMALIFELDPTFVYPYDPEPVEAAGSRLAKCTIQAVRENLPEEPVKELFHLMETGEVSPQAAMEKMLQPKLDNVCNATSHVHEAMEMMMNMTDNCKNFCMTFKMWEETNYQMSCANRIAKPMFDNSFAYNAMQEPLCRPDVECKLFNEMAPVHEKNNIVNAKVAGTRLRERRLRRLEIENRRVRRLEESKDLKKKCMSIDNVEYCASDNNQVAGMTSEELEKQRRLEYWEERGIDSIATATNPAKAQRISKFRSNRKQLRKSRRMNRRGKNRRVRRRN
ncbi:unnamed protein product [Amoebophrya sp. A120]|nr:unnamed protein product [Amoebophrya sp. A120]|eukprot:GSA120T00008516001.1